MKDIVRWALGAALVTIALLPSACGAGGSVSLPNRPHIDTTTLSNAIQGQSYLATVTASGGTGAGYSWSVAAGSLPVGLTLMSASPTAQIAGIPAAAGVLTFTLQVTDSAGASGTRQFTIEVAGAALGIAPASGSALPGATQGSVYTTALTASGGSGAGHVWTLLSGTLPPGLTLTSASSAATIAGLPTAQGAYSFTISVTDSASAAATAAYSLTVAPPLSLAIDAPPGGLLGFAATGLSFTTTIGVSGGSGAGHVWSLVPNEGSLPTGLTLTSGSPDATVSGTPPIGNSSSEKFTLSVTDSAGNVAQAVLSIQVVDTQQALNIYTPAYLSELPKATVGGEYWTELRTWGGSGEGYAWSVTVGGLPPGLRIVNGVPYAAIEGNPTLAGTYDFTVQVIDSAGGTDTIDVSIEVVATGASLFIESASDGPSFVVGIPNQPVMAPYLGYLHASGGDGAGYTWSIASGALPTGLMLSATGTPMATISGVMPCDVGLAGGHDVAITVTDSAGNTVTQWVTIFVAVAMP